MCLLGSINCCINQFIIHIHYVKQIHGRKTQTVDSLLCRFQTTTHFVLNNANATIKGTHLFCIHCIAHRIHRNNNETMRSEKIKLLPSSKGHFAHQKYIPAVKSKSVWDHEHSGYCNQRGTFTEWASNYTLFKYLIQTHCI